MLTIFGSRPWPAFPGRRGRLLFSLLLLVPPSLALGQSWSVGMSEEGSLITAYGVPAQVQDAATLLVIGGLAGDQASAGVVQAGYDAYANEAENFQNVIFLASANPDDETLQFPPVGEAYRDDWTSWSLWRWIGTHAPDGVIIMGQDPHGLGRALDQGIMGLGGVPSTTLNFENELVELIRGRKVFPESSASQAQDTRLDRPTEQVAQSLAAVYGQDFSSPTYIPGMALIGRMRLGQVDEVETLAAPYLEEDAGIEITSSLQIAAHLVFAELAQRTGNEDYLALARRAADLGFDGQGNMLEAMPLHGQYSDAVFMATPLLAKVGKLTGEPRYFDLALRHVEYLHELLLRPDGLYNHWPAAEAAWGRGNAFVALGLALALTDFPRGHPGHDRLLEIYRTHMEALLNYQDVDGMWRNVIDAPGAWAELSATAMIATAMQRGVDQGWLAQFYQTVVDRAWEGVLLRTDAEYGFVNVCESTPGQASLEEYLNREALTGRDDRAGGMMLMFATERLQHESL